MSIRLCSKNYMAILLRKEAFKYVVYVFTGLSEDEDGQNSVHENKLFFFKASEKCSIGHVG